MSQRSRAIRLAALHAVWSLLLAASVAAAQELPRATPEHGAFAFADRSGSKLIVTAPLAAPDALTTALCGDGRRVPVKYLRQQPAGAKDTGKVTRENFDQLPGALFQVVTGRVGGSATCLIAPDAFAAGVTAVSVRPLDRARGCEAAHNKRLSSVRGRRVIHCWGIAQVPPDMSLSVVQFVREGDAALGSVLLEGPEKWLFADYPAEYHGEGGDVWRAGDKGVLAPNDFRIVFLLKRDETYALGVRWGSAEGESLTLFVSDGNRFRDVINEYWYRSPQ
jgi:hypothetical protein